MDATSKTSGGADIFTPTAEEFESWVEGQLLDGVGMDLEAFRTAGRLEILDVADADVADMLGLVSLLPVA